MQFLCPIVIFVDSLIYNNQLNSIEVIYDNGRLGTKYIFDYTTGRLTNITLGVNNETISVDYLNQSYPSLFTHSNGKQLRITYNEGKVVYIDLVTEDGSILKSW